MGKPCRLNSCCPSLIEPTSTRRTRRLCLRCGLRSCSTTIPGSIQRRAGQVAGCVIGITLGPPWKRLCAGTSSAWPAGAPEEFPRQVLDYGIAIAADSRSPSSEGRHHRLQIGIIFVMGVVYAWLRIKSNSTTSPFLAHSAYNATFSRRRATGGNIPTLEPGSLRAPFRFSGGRFTIRSTEDFRSLLKAARRRYCHSSSGRSIRQRDGSRFGSASAAKPKPLCSPGTSWAVSPHATRRPKKLRPTRLARRLPSVRRMYYWPFTRALRSPFADAIVFFNNPQRI